MTAKKRSNACTKPDGETLDKIIKVTEDFFIKFQVDFLSAKTGINASSIRSMKCRLKLSQEAATKFCKLARVKASGFTREQLRPDIQIWFDEK